MKSDEQIHKERNWVATIVTLVMLVVAGLFVFRVLYYVDAIKSGKIDSTDFTSLGSYSSTSSLLAITTIPEGAIDVVSNDDPSLGSPKAPVVIVEFADFGCSYSKDASHVLRELAQNHPKDVYYVYRDFPINELHSIATLAAEAGECAHEQGKFWEYHDKLYQNQAYLDEEELYLLAEQVNLDLIDFRGCLESGKYKEEVQEDYEAGVEAGVSGTPTFYVNGNRIAGSIPSGVLELIVQSVIVQQEEE